MDELDRILGEDEGLEPSSGLTRRVMEAVEQDGEAAPPVPFPWVRLLPALVGAVGVVVAFGIYLASGAAGSALAFDLANWLEHPLAGPVGITVLSLAGSWGVIRVSMRLAGPAR